MRSVTIRLAVVAFVFLISSAVADVPSVINYQGLLLSPPPANNPIQGQREFRFSIHDQETQGTLIWSEVHPYVDVEDGLFYVWLGAAGSPLFNTHFEDQTRWLEIGVRDIDSPGIPYEVMDPRIQLAAVPYAFRVATVDSASGGTIKGDVEIRNGRLGIGTSDPQAILHVGGTPGVDGIMFPDGTVQTTAASTGSEIAVITGTANHNDLITPPAGYTVAQCKCIVSSHTSGPMGDSQEAYRHWCYVTLESGGWRVRAQSENAHYPGGMTSDIANYMVIGVR